MTKENVVAHLRQLFEAYPEDFRILPGDGHEISRIIFEHKAELHNAFHNDDPKLVTLIRSSLEEGKQVAIVVGSSIIVPLIAKRGRQLFAGPFAKKRAAAPEIASKESQGIAHSPPEVGFLSEVVEITTTETRTPLDIYNQANDTDGDTPGAIRLYNSALRMNPVAEHEIAIRMNRSGRIVRHFELDGRNKTSQHLIHVIAREHVVRDWEAVIGLWVENSRSFNENDYQVFKPFFDHVYLNYMPIEMGLMCEQEVDGKIKMYEHRIPRQWKIGWSKDGLLANDHLHSEYKFPNEALLHDLGKHLQETFGELGEQIMERMQAQFGVWHPIFQYPAQSGESQALGTQAPPRLSKPDLASFPIDEQVPLGL
ncbi:MAG: hypothetical protein MN733_42485, partial [Nitrososphaera sp.]|nr:hypothetical protein [Nitrososphaera sp.]